MRISDWSSDVCSSDLAALAVQAFQQRGFLAADIGTGAHAHFEVEIVSRAADFGTEAAGIAGDLDGSLRNADGVRVFRAAVDVALGGAHRVAGDGHALDQHEGIADRKSTRLNSSPYCESRMTPS